MYRFTFHNRGSMQQLLLYIQQKGHKPTFDLNKKLKKILMIGVKESADQDSMSSKHDKVFFESRSFNYDLWTSLTL